jgi:hypothetical protein
VPPVAPPVQQVSFHVMGGLRSAIFLTAELTSLCIARSTGKAATTSGRGRRARDSGHPLSYSSTPPSPRGYGLRPEGSSAEPWTHNDGIEVQRLRQHSDHADPRPRGCQPFGAANYASFGRGGEEIQRRRGERASS